MRALLLALLALTLAIVPAQAGKRAIPVDGPGYMGAIFGDASDFNGRPMVLVADVVPLSPAEWAGLHRGDEIKSINGTPPGTAMELRMRVRAAKPGTRLTVIISRDQALRAIPIEVSPLTPEIEAALEQKKGDSARALTAAGYQLVFLPQDLCYEWVAVEPKSPVTLAPDGKATVDTTTCRYPIVPCSPLALLEQSSTKTLLFNGAVRYKLKGDWRAVTFWDAATCEDTLSGVTQKQAVERVGGDK
jgi:membrane-associated protease RseP (regulator of RpoE activity)